MDRRSWMLFFCVLSTTLLVNHYFSPKISFENKQKVWIESIQANLREKQAESSVSLQDLSLVEIATQQGDKLFGVQLQGNVLAMAKDCSMPETITLDSKLAKLAFPNNTIEPIVYRTNAEKLIVHQPHLTEGSFFYIAYQKNGKKEPRILLATKQKKKIIVSEEVKKDSLAFDSEHRLIGVFEAKTAKIRSFDAYFRMVNQVTINDIATEHFYVLENEYQMLVFSSKGGSLAEINLPFYDKQNRQSVVKKIGADRLIQEQQPQSNRFPNQSYLVINNGSVQEKNPQQGGYYPLLRRKLVEEESSEEFSPKYYCCSVNEKNADPGIYKVTRFEKNLIEFRSSTGRRTITKRYTLPKNPKDLPYVFFLTVEVEGDSKGLYIQSGIPEVELISGHFSPSLKYLATRNGQSYVQTLSLPKVDDMTNVAQSFSPNWIVNSNGFLGVLMDPLNYTANAIQTKAISGTQMPTRLTTIDKAYNLYPAKNYPGYGMSIPFSKDARADFRIFAGPFEADTLQIIDQNVEKINGQSPEYTRAKSSHGWFSFISAPFSQFLFLLMRFFHSITQSWGLSIICITVVMRILLYPLNAWSFKVTQRSQAVMPQVKKIQEKYKNQPEKAKIELMKLYKETGYNPFMGCFPALIQMPFLLGMFDLLKSSFDLRGASFIPGWIDNLTAPDVLFSWNYPIFYLGTSFHLLPVIFALVTFAQQKLAAHFSGIYDGPLTEQQQQQKSIGNIMVIFLTIALYHFPSGLNIYWIFSTLLGILQQYFMYLRQGSHRKS